MKVSFNIHYNTEWGQSLAVTGNSPALGSNDLGQALILEHQGGGQWSGEAEVDSAAGPLEYKYLVIDDNSGERQSEWGKLRRIDLPEGGGLSVRDSWRAFMHPDNSLYTSAFRDVIFRPGSFPEPEVKDQARRHQIRFQIRAPRLEPGNRLCVMGNVEELGSWEEKKALLLGNARHPLWSGAISLRSGLTIEYKYGIYDPREKRVVWWEDGDNRVVPSAWLGGGRELVVTDEYFRHPHGSWRGAGVAIPVFSIRTRRSLGVGEFTDLRLMVDWARRAGLSMVQILPVNDTSASNSWVDSYPYAAISVFALHPLYLDVDDLGAALTQDQQQALETQREELNRAAAVDYEAVMDLKLRTARLAFKQVRARWLKSKDFREFFKDNEYWLKDYAAFCYLRDKHGTVDFNRWGPYAEYSAARLGDLTDPGAGHYDEIAFHYFLQYHLDRQLHGAAEYARRNHVVLKGDIPIGIYRYSVDAWVAPHLYNMDGQAGAPPDPFSDLGQNWGFPTYDWQEMAKDGYRWWRQRLQQLSRYFDAFRIDHILGFFRIWEIPIEQVQGLMGYFNPAIPVARQEFDQRGIPFDYDRYCRPYLPEHYLHRLFGEAVGYVKETFLEPDQPYTWRLKPDFETQRKLETFFAREENAGLRHLQPALFEAVANLLFFEVADSRQQAFHPRIEIRKTRSFQELNPTVKPKLEDLYINYFFRRQEDFWRQQALTKLPAIKSATNMLICGEDLGMVPDCVPGVMRELEILSLEIQRMSKNPQTEFLQLGDIPYLAVCSPSTHDMAPLRAWWEEMDGAQRERFFYDVLGLTGPVPFFCEPFVIERILRQHLEWPAMWAVFPLQDLLAMDGKLRLENPHEERINIPSIPRHYWRYRFHLNMEDLLEKDGFNDRLLRMVQGAGR